MKHPFTAKLLPLFSLGMGGLMLALRSWLYAFGVDDKGLFLPGHPANTLSFVITALFLGLLALAAFGKKDCGLKAKFPPSVIAAAGSGFGGLGILFAAISILKASENIIALVCGLVGILAGASLFFCGWCRWKGHRPLYLFHGLVTVFFLLFCICRYRTWSVEPQFVTCFFQLLACMMLMLYGYQRTAADAGSANPRLLVLSGQAAVFFCLAAIPDGNRLFFLSMAIWCASGSPTLSQKPGGNDNAAS